MPAYALEYRLDTQGVVCLVDAFSGVGRLVEPDSLSSEELDGDFFQPILAADRAHGIARGLLLRGILYRRRVSGIALDAPAAAVLVQYPYWVYYYRRRDLIDIRVLDAVTGEKVGQKIKLGLLEAFQQRARGEKGTYGEVGD